MISVTWFILIIVINLLLIGTAVDKYKKFLLKEQRVINLLKSDYSNKLDSLSAERKALEALSQEYLDKSKQASDAITLYKNKIDSLKDIEDDQLAKASELLNVANAIDEANSLRAVVLSIYLVLMEQPILRRNEIVGILHNMECPAVFESSDMYDFIQKQLNLLKKDDKYNEVQQIIQKNIDGA